ncbi:MAG: hypothetical protein HFE84_08840 [Lachnospiraceae bacterium]|jgi:hypothetical protein|nr:hypothetical protein [Lachnospiraceae bacterium]
MAKSRDYEEQKTLVYDLMNGSLNLDEEPIEESKYVENEFAKGSRCEELYREVYEANKRLCERLGADDVGCDDDVELIIDNLLEIANHLSMKMFDYGHLFALQEKGVTS